MTIRFLPAAAVGALALSLAGCAPIDERVQPRTAGSAPAPVPTPSPMERLSRSVDDLALRFEELSRSQQAVNRQLAEDLRAALASLQADIEGQDEELRHLNENFETLLSRFAALEGEAKRPTGASAASPAPAAAAPAERPAPQPALAAAPVPPPAPVRPSPIPAAGADETYRLGLDLYEAGKYREASSTFSDFVARFPKDPLVPNAIYWIGECQYAMGTYEGAIISFDQVIKEHPGSTKVPAALLKQAMAFRELGNKIQAKMILQNLMKRFPSSPEAAQAKQRLEAL